MCVLLLPNPWDNDLTLSWQNRTEPFNFLYKTVLYQMAARLWCKAFPLRICYDSQTEKRVCGTKIEADAVFPLFGNCKDTVKRLFSKEASDMKTARYM